MPIHPTPLQKAAATEAAEGKVRLDGGEGAPHAPKLVINPLMDEADWDREVETMRFHLQQIVASKNRKEEGEVAVLETNSILDSSRRRERGRYGE
mmetsp:Transcript_32569/g.65954  ORF Transcript_32569/g.65954 Transcript_32569/m.65954 type:complete len:95 (+) Transcript_32569:159-443(+)